MAARDRSPQRATLPDEVLLADELVEVARPHPRRQWLALGRWLEERLGPGAGWSPRWHGRMVAPAGAFRSVYVRRGGRRPLRPERSPGPRRPAAPECR